MAVLDFYFINNAVVAMRNSEIKTIIFINK